jgi:hypothetical protein
VQTPGTLGPSTYLSVTPPSRLRVLAFVKRVASRDKLGIGSLGYLG